MSYQQPPPGWPQQPPQGPPPGPYQPPRKSHRTRNILVSVASAVFLIIVIGIVAAIASAPKPAGQHSLSGGSASSPAPAAPAAQTTPPPSPPTTITFAVTGTGTASINYGSSNNNVSPPQCTGGDLGQSCTLPWTGSLPFDGTQQYWDITAQLDSGGGSITCTITASGPHDQPLVVATGHASGADQICDAQAAPTDSTGLTWQQE